MNLDYNYTAWAVIEGVGAETEVLLRGSVEYQPSASDLPESLSDVPLMVRFPVGRSGQVVFSTFHWNVQTPAVAQALLLQGVEGLQEGSGSSGDTAGEGGS